MVTADPASGQIQIMVPVYNEGENVCRLYEKLLAEAGVFDSLCFVYDFEEDTSLPHIARLAEGDERVAAWKNDLGRGLKYAYRYAFAKAEPGPVLVLMGDNSDLLSIIPQMIECWRKGATVVCPSRYMKGGAQHGGGLIKGTLSRIAGKSLALMGFPTSDPTNNFKLYDGAWLREQRIESGGGFEISLELCYKAFRDQRTIAQLPTQWFDRTEGQSKFRLMAWLPHYLYWYARCVTALLQRKLSKRSRLED